MRARPDKRRGKKRHGWAWVGCVGTRWAACWRTFEAQALLWDCHVTKGNACGPLQPGCQVARLSGSEALLDDSGDWVQRLLLCPAVRVRARLTVAADELNSLSPSNRGSIAIFRTEERIAGEGLQGTALFTQHSTAEHAPPAHGTHGWTEGFDSCSAACPERAFWAGMGSFVSLAAPIGRPGNWVEGAWAASSCLDARLRSYARARRASSQAN